MLKITRPSPVRGVALIVRNPRGEILLLRECETKPHFGKYAGMLSPPMETLLHRKEPLTMALHRLIVEELNGFDGHIAIEGTSRGIYAVGTGPLATLFVGQTERTDLPNPCKIPGEVDGYRWTNPRDSLKEWLRQGAPEMIADYLNDRRRVLCRRCAPPILPEAQTARMAYT